MKLRGSCHCGNVRFEVESQQPWPYQRCYCGVCRKTAGGGGFSINLGADASSLVVEGTEHVKIYRAKIERGERVVQSAHERHFCGNCGTHLWAQNPKWPRLVHPVAGAVDTPLPPAPSTVHMMVKSGAEWAVARLNSEAGQSVGEEVRHSTYPDTSLTNWHRDRKYRDPE